MTRWFILPRFGSCKPTSRWGDHKDRVSFNLFPLSNGHLDRVSFSPQSNGSLRPHKDHHNLVSLALITKLLRTRMGRRKAIQATRTQMNTKISLSLVTKCWERFWTWERIWSLVCVLEWSLELLYWMQMTENLDALKWWWLGVFIAQTTKTAVGEGCCRWAHRTVWCASHVTQPLGFWRSRPLELWPLGAPNSPVPHRTDTVHYPVRLLALLWLCANCPHIVHALFTFCRRPLAQ
jgi:hypothetical protein